MRSTLLCLLFPAILFSQNNTKGNAQLLGYNLAFGAIIGGTTELITNPRHVKPLKAFIHGFCSGTIGGAFNFAGKYCSGAVLSKSNYSFILPSRLISSFGNSIIYNTGHSKNFYFQYFNFDYGPVQISTDILNKKAFVKILPGSIGGIIVSAKAGGVLDWKHSLLMGVPCFTKVNPLVYERGYTYQTSITVNNNPAVNPLTMDSVRAHEFIHVLQCMEYSNISNIVLGWLPAYKQNTRVWKYLSVDLPYNDVAYTINSAFIKQNKYANNYFEVEARRFSRQAAQPINR